MTPRLAQIIAAMVDAKLDAETRGELGSRGRMARAGRPDRSAQDLVGRRHRGRP
jgi:hypothetical protein